MNKAKINYFIDIPLALSFMINAGTGILKMYGWFGTQPRDYITLHDYSGMIFVILGITHLAMHYKFYIEMTKNVFRKS